MPTIIFLEAGNERLLTFGVGHAESVLGFFEPDGTSLHSLGDPYRKGHLVFHSQGVPDDFALEMAVPESAALVAAEQFVTTQDRPAGIRWEAD